MCVGMLADMIASLIPQYSSRLGKQSGVSASAAPRRSQMDQHADEGTESATDTDADCQIPERRAESGSHRASEGYPQPDCCTDIHINL
jgi:hypothetical protein